MRVNPRIFEGVPHRFEHEQLMRVQRPALDTRQPEEGLVDGAELKIEKSGAVLAPLVCEKGQCTVSS